MKTKTTSKPKGSATLAVIRQVLLHRDPFTTQDIKAAMPDTPFGTVSSVISGLHKRKLLSCAREPGNNRRPLNKFSATEEWWAKPDPESAAMRELSRKYRQYTLRGEKIMRELRDAYVNLNGISGRFVTAVGSRTRSSSTEVLARHLRLPVPVVKGMINRLVAAGLVKLNHEGRVQRTRRWSVQRAAELWSKPAPTPEPDTKAAALKAARHHVDISGAESFVEAFRRLQGKASRYDALVKGLRELLDSLDNE